MKPNEYIVMILEKNDKLLEWFYDWAQVICKETRTSHIFLVDKVGRPDLYDIINGYEVKFNIFSTDMFPVDAFLSMGIECIKSESYVIKSVSGGGHKTP